VYDCLEQLDWSRAFAEHANEVELGLWFHDVVYDTHASDNEEQSAAWAKAALQNSEVAPEVTARVGQLILATRQSLTATRQISVANINGCTFFFYGADHKLPFATLATADNDYDRVGQDHAAPGLCAAVVGLRAEPQRGNVPNRQIIAG